MKYLYSLFVYLLFLSTCIAQKTEYHVSIGPNISFSSFSDEIHTYPNISPNTGYFSYSPLPPNMYRKTIPKLGLQVQGDILHKLNHKFYIGTGLRFLLYRHAYDQEFKENPFDPYGKRWDSEPGYQPPTILASPSDNIKHTRIMYLSIPIQFHYQMNSKMYGYSGINISTPLLVAQKQKSISFTGSSYLNFSENVLTDKSKAAFNKVNYGFQLSIRFKTSTYTSIKIDFNHSISNTYSGIEENNEIKSLIRTLNFSYDCLLDL